MTVIHGICAGAGVRSDERGPWFNRPWFDRQVLTLIDRWHDHRLMNYAIRQVTIHDMCT
jgi:hypothetical protein